MHLKPARDRGIPLTSARRYVPHLENISDTGGLVGLWVKWDRVDSRVEGRVGGTWLEMGGIPQKPLCKSPDQRETTLHIIVRQHSSYLNAKRTCDLRSYKP